MKKLKKSYVVNVKTTPEQRRLIFLLAKALGVKAFIGFGFKLIENVQDAIKDFADWNYITLNEDGLGACVRVDSYTEYVEVSFERFLEILAGNEIEQIPDSFVLELNVSNEAKVNLKTGIVKVGCQDFKIGVIIELVDKYKTLKEKFDKQDANENA